MKETYNEKMARLESKGNSKKTLMKMITIMSEICGIIGFFVSIAIFFYTQEISNQQNAMEKIRREQEVNNIIDNGMLTKLLLLQESDRYKQSVYKGIIDSIVNVERSFYLSFSANVFCSIGEYTYISKKNNKDSEAYFSNLIDFFTNDQELGNSLMGAYKSIKDSKILEDSLFSKKLSPQLNYLLSESLVMNLMSNSLNQKVAKIKIDLDNNKISRVDAANSIIQEMKEDDYVNRKINYYRSSMKFLDYISTNLLISPAFSNTSSVKNN